MAGPNSIVSRLMVAPFLMCAAMGSAAHAEKRVALVIGNSAYRAAPPLANPAADAALRRSQCFGHNLRHHPPDGRLR
jgi:hypothetical protein